MLSIDFSFVCSVFDLSDFLIDFFSDNFFIKNLNSLKAKAIITKSKTVAKIHPKTGLSII